MRIADCWVFSVTPSLTFLEDVMTALATYSADDDGLLYVGTSTGSIHALAMQHGQAGDKSASKDSCSALPNIGLRVIGSIRVAHKRRIEQLECFPVLQTESLLAVPVAKRSSEPIPSSTPTSPLVPRHCHLICLHSAGELVAIDSKHKILPICRNATNFTLRRELLQPSKLQSSASSQPLVIPPSPTTSQSEANSNSSAGKSQRAVLCVAQKKSLLLFAFRGGEYFVVQEIYIQDSVSALVWIENRICVGFRQEYVLIDENDGSFQEIVSLGPDSSLSSLQLTFLPETSEILLTGQNGLGIFYDIRNCQPSPKSSLIPLKPSFKTIACGPYLLCGSSSGSLEIYSIRTRALLQSLPLHSESLTQLCVGLCPKHLYDIGLIPAARRSHDTSSDASSFGADWSTTRAGCDLSSLKSFVVFAATPVPPSNKHSIAFQGVGNALNTLASSSLTLVGVTLQPYKTQVINLSKQLQVTNAFDLLHTFFGEEDPRLEEENSRLRSLLGWAFFYELKFAAAFQHFSSGRVNIFELLALWSNFLSPFQSKVVSLNVSSSSPSLADPYVDQFVPTRKLPIVVDRPSGDGVDPGDRSSEGINNNLVGVDRETFIISRMKEINDDLDLSDDISGSSALVYSAVKDADQAMISFLLTDRAAMLRGSLNRFADLDFQVWLDLDFDEAEKDLTGDQDEKPKGADEDSKESTSLIFQLQLLELSRRSPTFQDHSQHQVPTQSPVITPTRMPYANFDTSNSPALPTNSVGGSENLSSKKNQLQQYVALIPLLRIVDSLLLKLMVLYHDDRWRLLFELCRSSAGFLLPSNLANSVRSLPSTPVASSRQFHQSQAAVTGPSYCVMARSRCLDTFFRQHHRNDLMALLYKRHGKLTEALETFKWVLDEGEKKLLATGIDMPTSAFIDEDKDKTVAPPTLTISESLCEMADILRRLVCTRTERGVNPGEGVHTDGVFLDPTTRRSGTGGGLEYSIADQKLLLRTFAPVVLSRAPLLGLQIFLSQSTEQPTLNEMGAHEILPPPSGQTTLTADETLEILSSYTRVANEHFFPSLHLLDVYIPKFPISGITPEDLEQGYLEYVVIEMQKGDSSQKTHLCLLLANKVLKSMKRQSTSVSDEIFADPLTVSQDRSYLQKFLIFCEGFNSAAILGRLQNTRLLEEQVILLSSSGRHYESLRILTHRFRNVSAAITYCLAMEAGSSAAKTFFHGMSDSPSVAFSSPQYPPVHPPGRPFSLGQSVSESPDAELRHEAASSQRQAADSGKLEAFKACKGFTALSYWSDITKNDENRTWKEDMIDDILRDNNDAFDAGTSRTSNNGEDRQTAQQQASLSTSVHGTQQANKAGGYFLLLLKVLVRCWLDSSQDLISDRQFFADAVMQLLKEYASHPSLPPLEVLNALPDSWPLKDLLPILISALKRDVHDAMTLKIEEHLSSTSYLQTYNKWAELSSASITMTTDRACSVCTRRIGDKPFVATPPPNPSCVHLHCTSLQQLPQQGQHASSKFLLQT